MVHSPMYSLKVLPYLMVGLLVVFAEEDLHPPRIQYNNFEIAEAPQYYSSSNRNLNISRLTPSIHRIPRPIPRPTLIRTIPAELPLATEPQIEELSVNIPNPQRSLSLPNHAIPSSNQEIIASTTEIPSHPSESLSKRPNQRPVLLSRPVSSIKSDINLLNQAVTTPYNRPTISLIQTSRASYETSSAESSSIVSESLPKEFSVSNPQLVVDQQEISSKPPHSPSASPIIQPSGALSKPGYQRPIFSLRSDPKQEIIEKNEPISKTVSTMSSLIESSTEIPSVIDRSSVRLSEFRPMYQRPPLGVRPIPKPLNLGAITTARSNIQTDTSLNAPSDMIVSEPTQMSLDFPSTIEDEIHINSSPKGSQIVITDTESSTPALISTNVQEQSRSFSWNLNPPITIARPMNPSRPIGGVRYPVIASKLKPIPVSEPKSVAVSFSSKNSAPIRRLIQTASITGKILKMPCEQENGYLSRQDCGSYIECKNSVAVESTCPDGLHYNPKAIWPEYPCANPSEVKCLRNALEQKPNPTDECPRQYGLFPVSGQYCTKYIICQEGIATVMNCPPGLVFNPELSSCDWPEKVPSCNPEVFQGFSCPPTPLDEDGKPWDIILNFKYGNSCKKYIACQRGSPRLLSCDVGFSFDESLGHCTESDYVQGCVDNSV